MHFTLSMDLAIVMVTFFQNTKLGLSHTCHPRFHTGEEIEEQGGLHLEDPHGSSAFPASPDTLPALESLSVLHSRLPLMLQSLALLGRVD